MTVKELMKLLSEHDENLQVFFNDGYGPRSVNYIKVIEMEETVPDWNMEEGFTYVELYDW